MSVPNRPESELRSSPPKHGVFLMGTRQLDGINTSAKPNGGARVALKRESHDLRCSGGRLHHQWADGRPRGNENQ